MYELKLIAADLGVALVVPDGMLDRLNVSAGDTLYAVETPDGGYRLTSVDPAFIAKMDAADDLMRRYHHTLRTLFK